MKTYICTRSVYSQIIAGSPRLFTEGRLYRETPRGSIPDDRGIRAPRSVVLGDSRKWDGVLEEIE